MQKLARLLACSGVLATVALSAPGTALAISPDGGSPAPHGNGDPLDVPPLKHDEIWDSGEYYKISDGDIHLTPGRKNVDGKLCLQPYEFYSNTPLSAEKHVGKDPITLAAPAEAPRNTKFYERARNCGDGSTSDFHGWQNR
ncbi:MAG: hypothetical protein ACRDQ4_02895 [Pseudonocardiaceae bacterium]